jgi:hypothetical protein
MAKQTQRDKIWQLMLDRGPIGITPVYAMEQLGCMRLAARIHDLKNLDCHQIDTFTETSENRYGETVHFARYVAGEY